MNRVAIFIDGLSTYSVAKALNLDLDFKKLQATLMAPGEALLRAYYYTVTADDGDFEAIVPLLDFLEFNGFTVRTRAGQAFHDHETGMRKVRGSIIQDLTVEALTMATFYDRAVILSGDGDLVPLVDGLQRLGKRVSVVSTIKCCSDELRRQADAFQDLNDLRPAISRAPRAAKEAVNA